MNSTADSLPCVPLCVDLDGTLILSDSLHEALLRLVKIRPRSLLLLPFWLLQGRAQMKRKIAESVTLDASSLPYRQEVVRFLNEQHELGRTLVLATAADEKIAEGVAAHLGIFSNVVASDGKRNLKGSEKGAALAHIYGSRGFDYLGNSRADIPVWAEAKQAWAAGLSPGKVRRIRRRVHVEPMFPPKYFKLRNVVKLFRPHHWVKNMLIFSPLLLSHQIQDGTAWLRSCVTFLAFSLAASSVYVVNDLLDLDADRSDPSKMERPFASGTLPLGFGMIIAPALVLLALAVGFSLQPMVDLVLIAYLILNLAYSIRLKRVLFLDVLLLASFYVLRIFIGSVATGIPISPWFMAFSLFLFLSLALVKRISELVIMKAENSFPAGRSYTTVDQALLLNFGASSGYLSVLVLALYLNGNLVQSLYLYPSLLWGICPILLFWLSRLWLLAGRGQVHSDPIVFAITDRVSWLAALLVVIIWCAAWGLLPLPW